MITWSSWSPYAISGCCETHTAVLDLDTDTVGPDVEVVNIRHDMFCPGAGVRARGSRPGETSGAGQNQGHGSMDSSEGGGLPVYRCVHVAAAVCRGDAQLSSLITSSDDGRCGLVASRCRCTQYLRPAVRPCQPVLTLATSSPATIVCKIS